MTNCRHCNLKLSKGSLVYDSGVQYRVRICQRCERFYRVDAPLIGPDWRIKKKYFESVRRRTKRGD